MPHITRKLKKTIYDQESWKFSKRTKKLSKKVIYQRVLQAKLLEDEDLFVYTCSLLSNTQFVRKQMFRSSHISVFWFLVFWSLQLLDFLSFFPSCPSCLAKCKQRLRNIFVTSSPKVTKTKNEKWDNRNIIYNDFGYNLMGRRSW